MISTKEFKRVLSKGVELAQFALLSYLYGSVDITELLTFEKVKAILNLMVKRNLVLVQGITYSITQKGKELYEELRNDEPVVEKTVSSFSYENLHKSLIEKLKALTGKSQKKVFVKGTAYSFMMSNLTDFRKRVEDVVKKYKIQDMNKLQKVLLGYIEECYKTDSWFPLLIYYISKDGTSRLASDYDEYQEEEVQVEKEEVDTRKLF